MKIIPGLEILIPGILGYWILVKNSGGLLIKTTWLLRPKKIIFLPGLEGKTYWEDFFHKRKEGNQWD